MKVAILGGGFGLYGYLPALIQKSHARIVLPLSYREKLLSRPDIRGFAADIQWAEDDDGLFAESDAVVIAVAPEAQAEWVDRCLAYSAVQFLMLEKPLAPTPQRADILLDKLIASGRRFRIGYNFRFTEWGKTLRRNNRGLGSLEWRFQAHHYRAEVQTWKRHSDCGGGALRFYGIHVIALMAELGYKDVLSSSVASRQPGDCERWDAVLTGPELPNCSISVNSHDQAAGFCLHDGSWNVGLQQPFESAGNRPSDAKIDGRVPVLAEALSDLFFEAPLCYDWYRGTNKLWATIEEKTVRA